MKLTMDDLYREVTWKYKIDHDIFFKNLNTALSALKPREAELIMLRYGDGFTLKKCAGSLNPPVTPERARCIISRGVSCLKFRPYISILRGHHTIFDKFIILVGMIEIKIKELKALNEIKSLKDSISYEI